MAKCKNCIHNEVCDQSSRMMWAAMEGKTECDDFKDRTRYVAREKGEWVPLGQRTYGGGRSYTHYCNRCGQHGYDDYVLCPNCGADMRKGENG